MILKIYNPIGNQYLFGENTTSFKSIDDFLTAMPENDNLIDMRINCAGGSVTEGWAIYDKLRASGKKITATIEGQCASMASIVLLAASERKGVKHASLLIHKPYISGFEPTDTLRSDDFKNLADDLENDTNKMLDLYVERTGANRATLESLMNSDKEFGMEQALTLGFISEIIPPKSALKINNLKFDMEKKSKLAQAFALIGEALGVKKSEETKVAYELKTESGDTLTIDKPEGEEPLVGDNASPDGEHKMPDGKTIVVTDGVITEIREAEEGPENEELTNAKAEIETLKAEIEALKANAKSEDEKRILNLVKVAGGMAWVQSNYKPAQRTAGKAAGEPEKISNVQIKLNKLKKQ